MVQISPMPGRRTAEIDHAEIKYWEYALTCSLPDWTSYEDLQIRRADMLSYLKFLTRDLAQGDPERAVTEIQRAANRLKTIASLTPIALAAAIRKHPELRTHVQIKRLRQVAAQHDERLLRAAARGDRGPAARIRTVKIKLSTKCILLSKVGPGSKKQGTQMRYEPRFHRCPYLSPPGK